MWGNELAHHMKYTSLYDIHISVNLSYVPGCLCVSDVNECSHWDNFCPQTCVNTRGSFKCECQAGFIDVTRRGTICEPAGEQSCNTHNTHAHIHAQHTHTHSHTNTHAHTCIHRVTHMHMHTHAHMRTRAHAHTRTRTHAHAHTHR